MVGVYEHTHILNRPASHVWWVVFHIFNKSISFPNYPSFVFFDRMYSVTTTTTTLMKSVRRLLATPVWLLFEREPSRASRFTIYQI